MTAYASGFALQSNYARTNAVYVAEAASRGLITTHLWGGEYGNQWRVTRKGLALLQPTGN